MRAQEDLFFLPNLLDGLSFSRFSLAFPRMLCIRVGGFQPPSQKHNGVKSGFLGISKQQREQSFIANSRYIRYCGSRVFNTLVRVWGG